MRYRVIQKRGLWYAQKRGKLPIWSNIKLHGFVFGFDVEGKAVFLMELERAREVL